MAIGDERIGVTIGAQIEGLIAGMSEASAVVREGTESMVASFEVLSGVMEAFNGIFLAMTALMGGGEMFKETVGHVAELGVELEHMSAKTGIAAEELSRLINAGKFTETGADTLGVGLKKLAVNMQEGSDGSSKAAEALRLMGISAVDSHGKTKALDDMLMEISGKFVGYEDGANKAAIAVALFGRSGTELIPFLDQGPAKIQELKNKSDDLGATMKGENLEAAKKYTEATKELGLAFDGLKLAMGGTFIGFLTKVVENFRDLGVALQHPAALLHAMAGDMAGMAKIFGQQAAEGQWDWSVGIGKLGQPEGGGKKAAPRLSGAKKDENELFANLDQRKLREALAAAHERMAAEKAQYELEEQMARDDYAKKRQLAQDRLTQIAMEDGMESAAYIDQVKKLDKIDEDEKKAKAKRDDDEMKRQNRLLKEQETFNKAHIDAVQKQWTDSVAVIGNAFNSVVDSVLRGTQTMADAWRNMGADILLSMIHNAEKGLEVFIASELTKRALHGEGAKKSILQSAWEAAAATYASVSEIPYVGWLLAPGAAVGAAAAVLAFGSNIDSAAGGYDIPAGSNPMTQLHQNEMVLPADIAQPLRQMVKGGGGGGGTFHIYAMDSQSLHDYLQQNAPAVTAAAMRGVAMGHGGGM